MNVPEENAYELLGLQQGPASSDADIKKAYRKHALAKHPDKNPDNPNAANEFAALQRAYDLLLDADARAALDSLLKARAVRLEKSAAHDDKRRRMMQDLERRERASGQQRSQEEAAREKLQAEVERLRRAAAQREKAAAAARKQAAPHAAAQPSATHPAAAANGLEQRLPRTLKVVWARRGGQYEAPQLRTIFAQCGAVDDVIVMEGKRKKGIALVVMGSVEGAAAAAHAVLGDLSNPLLVMPLAKAANDGDEADGPAFGGGPASSSSAAQGLGSGALSKGYEDDTLERLRRAAERRRELEALQREEQEQEEREEGQRGAS